MAAKKAGHEQAAIIERQRQEVAIALAYRLETRLEAALQAGEDVTALGLVHGVIGGIRVMRAIEMRLEQIKRQASAPGCATG